MLLSRNYEPTKDLAPYIARHYLMSAELPEDMVITDSLMSETAFIRILVRGDWQVLAADGEWRSHQGALIFGGNARPMRVRVKGPFTVIGMALRPCGWQALFEEPARDFADTMTPLGNIWGDIADNLYQTVVQNPGDDDAVVQAMEHAVRQRRDERGKQRLNDAIAGFEPVIIADSTRKVEEVAGELGLSLRQLERLCIRHFGHTPKMIMRRSRFLDMAAILRGLGTSSEAEMAELSFFDQSHLIREFRQFIGMTAAEFEKASTPLLDAGLELRQQRKAAVKQIAAV